MFQRSSLALVFGLLAVLLPNIVFAGDNERIGDLIGKWEQIQKTSAPSRVGSEDDLVPAFQSISKSEGLEAAMLLWKNGKRLPVELAWWRSPYRSTRVLVIALFYSQYEDRDVDFFPRFKQESLRFEAKERDDRLEEIRYVEKNLDEIKKVLGPVLAATP